MLWPFVFVTVICLVIYSTVWRIEGLVAELNGKVDDLTEELTGEA